jgi:hypothetical protein
LDFGCLKLSKVDGPGFQTELVQHCESREQNRADRHGRENDSRFSVKSDLMDKLRMEDFPRAENVILEGIGIIDHSKLRYVNPFCLGNVLAPEKTRDQQN